MKIPFGTFKLVFHINLHAALGCHGNVQRTVYDHLTVALKLCAARGQKHIK